MHLRVFDAQRDLAAGVSPAFAMSAMPSALPLATIGLRHTHLMFGQDQHRKVHHGKVHHGKQKGSLLAFAEVDVDFDSEVLAYVLQPSWVRAMCNRARLRFLDLEEAIFFGLCDPDIHTNIHTHHIRLGGG